MTGRSRGQVRWRMIRRLSYARRSGQPARRSLLDDTVLWRAKVSELSSPSLPTRAHFCDPLSEAWPDVNLLFVMTGSFPMINDLESRRNIVFFLSLHRRSIPLRVVEAILRRIEHRAGERWNDGANDGTYVLRRILATVSREIRVAIDGRSKLCLFGAFAWASRTRSINPAFVTRLLISAAVRFCCCSSLAVPSTTFLHSGFFHLQQYLPQTLRSSSRSPRRGKIPHAVGLLTPSTLLICFLLASSGEASSGFVFTFVSRYSVSNYLILSFVVQYLLCSTALPCGARGAHISNHDIIICSVVWTLFALTRQLYLLSPQFLSVNEASSLSVCFSPCISSVQWLTQSPRTPGLTS